MKKKFGTGSCALVPDFTSDPVRFGKSLYRFIEPIKSTVLFRFGETSLVTELITRDDFLKNK